MGDKLKENVLYTKETEILSAFISKIRFAYSLDDLFTAVRQELEDRGDCSVLFIDRQSQYVIYNSPDRLVSDTQTMQTLERNFPARHMDGIYFLDAEFGIVSNQNAARGFFIAYQKKHFYVF
ncbi:MAG: serine/threonine protein phosphatase, partial [Spirochaetaceae bacterium]|nr:serine/threonine protein phosphatase [Spirochaetaceae bacterium]